METKVSPLKFVKNLFLAVLGLHGCTGFSSCGEWGSYCLVAEPWLQGSWASGIASHRLSPSSFPASRAQTGSVVVANWLSCSAASGIFLDKRIEPEFPALAGGFFTTEPPGKPLCIFFGKILFSEGPCGCQGAAWRVTWSGAWCGCLGGCTASLGCSFPLAPATAGHHQFGRNVALEMEPTFGLWEGSKWNYERKCCLMIMPH